MRLTTSTYSRSGKWHALNNEYTLISEIHLIMRKYGYVIKLIGEISVVIQLFLAVVHSYRLSKKSMDDTDAESLAKILPHCINLQQLE